MARNKSASVLDQAPEEEMPSRLEPMLAKPGHIPESDSGEWAYEIKWDGVRALGYADHGALVHAESATRGRQRPLSRAGPDRRCARGSRRDRRRRGGRARPRGQAALPAAPEPHGTDLADGNQGTRGSDAGGLRDLRPAAPRRPLRTGPPLRPPSRAARGAGPRRAPLANPSLPARTAAPACSRRPAARGSRASSRSAQKAPTGRAGAAGSGSRSASGAARSS